MPFFIVQACRVFPLWGRKQLFRIKWMPVHYFLTVEHTQKVFQPQRTTINLHMHIPGPCVVKIHASAWVRCCASQPHGRDSFLSENPASKKTVSTGFLHISISGSSDMFSHSIAVKEDLNEFSRVDAKGTF